MQFSKKHVELHPSPVTVLPSSQSSVGSRALFPHTFTGSPRRMAFLYATAFRFRDMGAASAMAWIMLVIIAVFTAGMFLTARYWVYYGDQVTLR